MIALTLGQIAEVLECDIEPDLAQLVVDGPVTTDSRQCGAGSLYVARIGEHADGHEYIEAAGQQGAIAYLGSVPNPTLPGLIVADVQVAFGRVARLVRDSSRADVVAITGSSGKTSVKDLLALVLASKGLTVAPENSLNSEIGVPLTVCRLTEDSDYLVAELGARGVGHIDYLMQIAAPRVGIVLNVGSAHVGEFGSVDAIARAKSELPAGLPAADAGGVAILNADDPRVAAMASATSAKVVLVGLADEALWRASEITLDRGRPRFTLTWPEGSARVELPLLGEHNVGNALSVLAAAHEMGVEVDDAIAVLATAEPASRWRMEVHELAQQITVVNDAYNANPDSMEAALRAIAAMRGDRRVVAILGPMLELGADSDSAHAQIGALAAQTGVDELIVVGEAARPMVEKFAEDAPARRVTWVPDANSAYDLLTNRLAVRDVVLVKSSRDAGLRLLGDRLCADPQFRADDQLRAEMEVE